MMLLLQPLLLLLLRVEASLWFLILLLLVWIPSEVLALVLASLMWLHRLTKMRM